MLQVKGAQPVKGGIMDILSKVGTLLNGKKTYIVAALVGIAAALQALGIDIPWVIVGPILGALGLGAVRSAVNKPPTP